MSFSEEAKVKMSISHLGERNGRFGTKWLHQGSESKVVKLEEVQNYLENGWSLGRVPKQPKKRKLIETVCPECSKTFMGQIGQIRCSRSCAAKPRAIAAAKTRAMQGTNPGWARRTGQSSYPEQFFERLLAHRQIAGWTREKKIGKWFIDFAFEAEKLALEIDGSQHKFKERKAKDRLKDTDLTDLGWTIVRINWVNPINEKNKLDLYSQADAFEEALTLRRLEIHDST